MPETSDETIWCLLYNGIRFWGHQPAFLRDLNRIYDLLNANKFVNAAHEIRELRDRMSRCELLGADEDHEYVRKLAWDVWGKCIKEEQDNG